MKTLYNWTWYNFVFHVFILYTFKNINTYLVYQKIERQDALGKNKEQHKKYEFLVNRDAFNFRMYVYD